MFFVFFRRRSGKISRFRIFNSIYLEVSLFTKTKTTDVIAGKTGKPLITFTAISKYWSSRLTVSVLIIESGLSMRLFLDNIALRYDPMTKLSEAVDD